MRRFNIIVLASLLQVAAADTRVLVIDTGVDATNPTLAEVFCPAEYSLDVTTGRSVVGIPEDNIDHGTHVAGIIRALAGSSGYCMAFCKYYSGPRDNNLLNTIKCLAHAEKIGARYINYSSGGRKFDKDERAAIKAISGFVVVAAGNDGVDVDKEGYYPAAYRLPNEIIVGAYNSNCNKMDISNYGRDIQYYLGESLYSSLPSNTRGAMTGTSMAAAVATGTMLRASLGLPTIGDCQAYRRFFLKFWSTH